MQGYGNRTSYNTTRGVVQTCLGIMVTTIGISSGYIHVGFARPEGCIRLTIEGEQPDEIVQTLHVRIVIKHELPETYVLAAAFLTPPEPGAPGFVERTPDDRNPCRLRFRKLGGRPISREINDLY